MFLLLYRNYLLEYVLMYRVRSGDCRRAEVLGGRSFLRHRFYHMSLVESFIRLDVVCGVWGFLAGKWVCFPGDSEEAHGDAGGGRKQGFAD